MPLLEIRHFERAIGDVAVQGDNDMLPFDVDTRFISECSDGLVKYLHGFADVAERKNKSECRRLFQALSIFSERLLAPAGPFGFRTTTKLHPVWNLYLNAIGVALAECNEPTRSDRAHSYRYSEDGPSIFCRERSWRSFREACVLECKDLPDNGVVVQTDISGFYDHVYHHRLENYVEDLAEDGSNISTQVAALLPRFSAGRSFGLPVGGQGARVLAEVLLTSVDRVLTTAQIRWHRYVDDFVLLADNSRSAYEALGVLAEFLANLGLSLNKNKTTMLSSTHFSDYVEAQIRGTDDESRKLKEVDLHFDPYSDTPDEDYERLKSTVADMDITRLLIMELDKGQPDGFLISQVTRSLRLLEPDDALGVCATLLDSKNMHAFRASWASIMRGVGYLRSNVEYCSVHGEIDNLLDFVPESAAHLLSIDTNVLHYLRTIRHARTETRAGFLGRLYRTSSRITVRRASMDCWRHWKDREQFLSLRNNWESMSPEEQRMLWLAAPNFSDDGENFRKQVESSLKDRWSLGIERRSTPSFVDLYTSWATDGA